MIDSLFSLGRSLIKRTVPYEVQVRQNLIQSIRLTQALMEAGITVSIPETAKSTYDHLNKYFPVRYVVNAPNAKVANVTISHSSKPFVKIGTETRTLLFPRCILDLCRQRWVATRDIDFLFLGLLTDQRKSALTTFENRIRANYPNATIKFEHTMIGRTLPSKAWDDSYSGLLGRTKYVVCLNGDFVWSYRFFEAIFCGAVPIVEDECEAYLGYHYGRMDADEFAYDPKEVEDNFKRSRELLVMESKKLRALV
jgi:hypothetical protein